MQTHQKHGTSWICQGLAQLSSSGKKFINWKACSCLLDWKYLFARLFVLSLKAYLYSGVVEICSSLWQGKFRRVCWRVLAAVQEMPFFESFSMMLGAARQLAIEWKLGGCLCFGGPLTVANTGSTYRVITVNGDGNCFFSSGCKFSKALLLWLGIQDGIKLYTCIRPPFRHSVHVVFLRFVC